MQSTGFKGQHFSRLFGCNVPVPSYPFFRSSFNNKDVKKLSKKNDMEKLPFLHNKMPINETSRRTLTIYILNFIIAFVCFSLIHIKGAQMSMRVF